jgi:hypothetical protein
LSKVSQLEISRQAFKILISSVRFFESAADSPHIKIILEIFQQIVRLSEILFISEALNIPANTGSDNTNYQAVIKIDHTKRVNLSKVRPILRIFIIVTIKFIAPNNEDIPAICKLKILKSTAVPK